jgi:hypothetical protein
MRKNAFIAFYFLKYLKSQNYAFDMYTNYHKNHIKSLLIL